MAVQTTSTPTAPIAIPTRFGCSHGFQGTVVDFCAGETTWVLECSPDTIQESALTHSVRPFITTSLNCLIMTKTLADFDLNSVAVGSEIHDRF